MNESFILTESQNLNSQNLLYVNIYTQKSENQEKKLKIFVQKEYLSACFLGYLFLFWIFLQFLVLNNFVK